MTCNVYVMHVNTCNNILGVSLMELDSELELRDCDPVTVTW